jgi:hypothetical protein
LTESGIAFGQPDKGEVMQHTSRQTSRQRVVWTPRQASAVQPWLEPVRNTDWMAARLGLG